MIKKVIDEAIELQRKIALLTEELNAKKVLIREHARKHQKGESTVKIAASDGRTASVSFVKEKLKLTNLGEPEVMRIAMTPEEWASFFEVKPDFRSSAAEAYNVLDLEKRKAYSRFFEWVTQEPRVTLPK